MTMATIERLRGALQALLEVSDLAPERNCNCTSHLAPPCGDCVEWAALREARQQAEAVMAEPYLAAAAELQPVPQPADAPRYIELAARLTAAMPQAAAVCEEIMVNAEHGVFTLPLQPSGLLNGPRFVVHVPGPEQPAAEYGPDAAARAYAARMGDRWEHMGEEARQRARELAAQRLEPPL